MTDQDNLRDRIAKVLYDRSRYFAVYGRTWDEEMENTEGMSDEIDSARDDAQAIIDHFGLTTETHAATHAKRTMTRITSAWEWDNQCRP